MFTFPCSDPALQTQKEELGEAEPPSRKSVENRAALKELARLGAGGAGGADGRRCTQTEVSKSVRGSKKSHCKLCPVLKRP